MHPHSTPVLSIGVFVSRYGEIMTDAPKEGLTKKVAISRVIDGDTIEVAVTWHIKVRILGRSTDKVYLNAPEKNTPEGQKAIADVLTLLTNADWGKNPATPRFKDAVLYIPAGKTDELLAITSFDRVLGDLWVDGAWFGQVIEDKGIAKLVPFKTYPPAIPPSNDPTPAK
jgi:endonuclease YncB( thermonuclease family)